MHTAWKRQRHWSWHTVNCIHWCLQKTSAKFRS